MMNRDADANKLPMSQGRKRRTGRIDCPVCESRDALDRLVNDDTGRGEWAFGCSKCGRVLIFAFKAQMWLVHKEPPHQIEMGI